MAESRQTKRPKNDYDTPGTLSTKLGFLSLPLETQKDIVKQVPRASLPALQRVSTHFHSLASAQLYGDLAFFLTHVDSPIYYNKPSTRLADALQTFATSEHDYGQYVKSFSVELSGRDADEIQRRVASKFHFEEEATRFLNTAILLMLRRTQMLESFIWDLPIELSTHVFAALAKIHSLHMVHVRLDTQWVPRLASFSISPAPPGHHQHHHHHHGAAPTHAPPIFGTVPGQQFSTTQSSSTTSSLPVIARYQKANPNLVSVDRRKFSGLTHLQRLSIVGIDELNCIAQIASCMTACSASLKSLKISLSQELARKARKPSVPPPPANPAANALDDDEDDDMTQPDDQPSTVAMPAVNEADIKKEKVAQEAILAKIFGLQPSVAEDKKVDKMLAMSAAKPKHKLAADEAFFADMKDLIVKLATYQSSQFDQQHFLKLVKKSVADWMESKTSKSKKKSQTNVNGSKTKKDNAAAQLALASPHLFHPSTLKQQFYELFGDDNPSLQEVEEYLDCFGFQGSSKPNSSLPSHYYVSGSPQYTGGLSGAPMNSIFNGSVTNSHLLPTHSSGQALGGPQYYHSNSPHGPATDQWYAKPKAQHPSAALVSSSHNDSGLFKGPVSSGVFGDSVQASSQQVDDESVQDIVESESEDSLEEANPDAAAKKLDQNSKANDVKIFPAAVPNPADEEDHMDVDMEHPDIVESDTDIEELVVEESINGNQPANENIHPALTEKSADSDIPKLSAEPIPPEPCQKDKQPLPELRAKKKSVSAEETMQGYIRSKHGFQLEELFLHLVPLRPSVIGRALDLSFLQRLTLLNVGQQSGFWTLVDKVQEEGMPIQLRSIHTDDVTLPFLNCVSNLDCVTELFMMKRNYKDGNASSKSVATLNDIRLLAIRRHIATLKRLVVMNNEDETWDLDAKCIRLLTAKGTKLREMAFSVSLSDYHILMQGLPGLSSLIAFHILALRTTDPCLSVTRECRRFTADTIFHCPGLPLKYLAVNNIVYELTRSPPLWKRQKTIDSKGKGKAKATDGLFEKHRSDSDDFSDIENMPLEMACTKNYKYCDIPGIKIFEKTIRTGKL